MINPLKSLMRRAVRLERQKARAAQERHDWKLALNHWKGVLRLDPANVNAMLQSANMHNELSNYEHARRGFERIKAFPNHRLHAEIGLAGVAVRLSDWPTAKHHWEETLSLMAAQEREGASSDQWPMSPSEILLHLAIAHHSLGDTPAAERDLFAAFAVNPKIRRRREAWLIRSRLTARHDLPAAYRILLSARSQHPEDYSILYETIKAATGCGDRKAATLIAAEFAERFPDSEDGRALLASLGLTPARNAA